MEINKIRNQFIEKLKVSGWDRVLKDFIYSSEFEVLMQTLAKKHSEGILTPNIKQVFRAFYECPYNKLCIVIVGQDPYPQKNVADGLAFSCGNTRILEPSLKVILQEIQDTVEDDFHTWDPDLVKWSRQGILLINTALTTEIDKIGIHYDMWKPFISYLFNKLTELNSGLIYIFMGAAAREWAKKIPESNYKMFCYHPASACYTSGKWDSNDVFNRANELVQSNNGIKIIW